MHTSGYYRGDICVPPESIFSQDLVHHGKGAAKKKKKEKNAGGDQMLATKYSKPFQES